MATTELWQLGAARLAEAIRERRVSSREVVKAHLERIRAVNGRLNAIVAILEQEALAAADTADKRLAAGEPARPLEGVPITIKENLDVAGSATTHGVLAFAEAVASEDAPSIAHLRTAGAIPLGRTNMPDFAMRWHTDSALHGPTLNPWHPSLTPGGSSGGEAVAVAAGMSPLGIGTDLGGSLRWPAQCNGVATLRPSMGRIPHASSLMPAGEPIGIQLMDSRGPIARHVDDLRLALEIMSRTSPRDPWHTPAQVAGSPRERPVRVAVVVDPGRVGVDSSVAAGVRRAARELAAAGYAVEELEPPSVVEAHELWGGLLGPDLRAAWPDLGPLVSDDTARSMSFLLDSFTARDPVDTLTALRDRDRVARAWGRFMDGHPLLLGPVCTRGPCEPAFDLDRGRQAEILAGAPLVLMVNVLGLPSVAVPVGVENGLPQVVQIVGRRYREDMCLEAGEVLESRLGTITPIEPRSPL